MGARREATGLAFNDDFTGAGNLRGDRRQLARSTFQQCHGKAFPAGREHESVRGLHPAEDIRLKAKETDAGLEPERSGLPAEFLLAWAGAGDGKAAGWGKLREGRKEGGVVLNRIKAARGKPEEFLIERKLAAKRCADRRIRPPHFCIDAVWQDRNLLGH